MKAILLLGIFVALGLAGCGNSFTPSRPLPALGGFTVIATIGGSEQMLTYSDSLDVACIENASIIGNASRGTAAAFSCWETSVAPKKIQELVKRYKNQCDAGLSC